MRGKLHLKGRVVKKTHGIKANGIPNRHRECNLQTYAAGSESLIQSRKSLNIGLDRGAQAMKDSAEPLGVGLLLRGRSALADLSVNRKGYWDTGGDPEQRR